MENLNLFPRNLEVGMFYAKKFMEKVIVLDLIIIYLTWKNSSNFKKFVQDCFYNYAWVTQDFMPIHANKKRVLTTYLTHKVTYLINTVKLGNKEQFDKEQIGIKEPFPVTNFPFTLKDKELLALRNNFRATKKFLNAKFDCTKKWSPKLIFLDHVLFLKYSQTWQ